MKVYFIFTAYSTQGKKYISLHTNDITDKHIEVRKKERPLKLLEGWIYILVYIISELSKYVVNSI